MLITVLKGIKFPPHKDHLNPQTTALRAATGRAGHKSGCVGRAMGSLQKSAKSERHVQLGFGWSPAALPDDPIEDFSEPGLEPPKPEVQVRMHGAMELGEVPLVMDERPTSLPTTRAPMAEMTKQEAKELFATIQGHELLRKPP